MVSTPRFAFSILARRLAAKRAPKKYKLKTRKAAARRFRVVSKLNDLTRADGGLKVEEI